MVDFTKPDEPSDEGQPQQPQTEQPQTEQTQAQPQAGAEPQTPIAGWYEDPEFPNSQRWWDGSQWTEARQPLAPQTPPPGAGGAPFGTPPPGGQWGPGAGQPAGFGPPVPPAPAYGAMSPNEERNWAIAAHISALAAAWVGLGVFGPLLVYLLKKDESPWVRAHAAASLNFQLSWLIWGVGLGITTVLLMIVIVGFLLIPVLIAGAIAWLVFVILATIGASKNEQPYKYPLTIEFVK